jgi:hypothetical protein
MQVVYGTKLDIEEVADLAMAVRIVTDPVELQVDEASPASAASWRIPCFLRTQFHSSPPERWSNRSSSNMRQRRGKYGDMVGSPPENWMDI